MSFKVLFLYPNFRLESLVPPGIALLSRILKNHGISVELFDITDYRFDASKDHDKLAQAGLNAWPSEHRQPKYADRDPWKDLNEKVSSFGPDLIGVSTTESTFLLGVEMVKHIEHRNPRDMPVIFGGNFATEAPERALSFKEVDLLCVGEGERTILELCQLMERGEPYLDVPGLAYKDRFGMIRRNQMPLPVDLNENPTDFDIGLFDPIRLVRPMQTSLYRMAPVETMRGCPYHCDFCNSADTVVRKKSMARVREELLYYRDVHAVEYNFFWADTFLAMTPRELDEFCEIYRDVGLPFWVQTRVETITDWRLKQLKDVGLHKIAFGIENGDEKFRQQVVIKEFSNDDAVRKLAITTDMGVIYNTNNMVGYPFETREIAMETVRLNRRFKGVDTVNCFVFTPYYGTGARVKALKAGFIDPDVICQDTNEDSVLTMPQFTKEQIRGVRRCFPLYVKFPEHRWKEIQRAETDDALLTWLQKEYQDTFFKEPVIQF